MRAADVREEREHLHAGLGIQRAGRLVAQQQRRVLAQRAAMDTRCCSPPESWAGKLFMRWLRPTCSMTVLGSSASLQTCRASSTFSSAVRLGIRL